MSATTGKQITIIADPQPGTTNTPFPSDKQPAFFPVEFSVTDDHPLAIYGQTNTMLARNEIIMMGMIQLTNAMNSVADKIQANAKTTLDIDIALSGLATSLSMTQLLLSARVANSLKFNDVYNGKFNDVLKYKSEIDQVKKEIDPVEEQIANAVVEGKFMVAAAAEENTVIQFIQGAVNGLTGWFKDTAFYTSMKKYVDDIFESMTAIIPPSWRGKANNTKAVTGDSTIGP
jgi:hypothetical protein